jgi:hypothetical protein
MPAVDVTVFEIIPHPLHRGDWLLKANENAEIRVSKRGGILPERRVLKAL